MSWTNAAVTEAGLALQAKLVDGQTLGFLRVAAGTGTVDPSVLANQTALANEKQTLTFQPPNVLDGAKIKVPVMLNNIGLESGYTMQQLGFFAEDPDNGEILYAIVQDEVGDTVPSQTESPGFVIEWAFVFQYGNASEVTVKFDPVGLVSIGMVGAPNGVAGLDDKGAVPIEQGGTGATTAQAALAALGAGVRPNLLDNAIFIGGGTGYGTFPVNQKGRLSGNTDRQFICDRWNQFGSDWSLTKDGLVISKRSDAAYWSFFQLIPGYLLSQLVGKTATVSVLLDRVLATATQVLASPVTYFSFENGERAEIYIPDDDTVGAVQYYGSTTTRTVKAIKFEIGTAQTLAYQDADGAWHLLLQPESDYATQLLRCQQYLFDCGNVLENFPAAMNGTSGDATVQIPVTMAKKPVLVNKKSGYGVIYTGTGALAVTNAVVQYLDGNYVIISLQTESSVVSNCIWRECSFWLDTGM